MTDMMTHGSFGWNELATTDSNAARKFFGGLIGWTFKEVPMPGGGGSYIIAKAGEQRVGGMFKMGGERFKGLPSHWMGYITVSYIDAAAKKVPNLGGTLMMPPTDIPNVGRFCILSDPSGATLPSCNGPPR